MLSDELASSYFISALAASLEAVVESAAAFTDAAADAASPPALAEAAAADAEAAAAPFETSTAAHAAGSLLNTFAYEATEAVAAVMAFAIRVFPGVNLPPSEDVIVLSAFNT